MAILNNDQIAYLVAYGEVQVSYGEANLECRMTREPDDCLDYPWKEYDGHGIVSDWENRAKRPYERVLAYDGGRSMFYDVQGSIEKARKEGWGLPEEEAKGLTKKQIAAAAVERDFKYCKKWANEGIWWDVIGVSVYVNNDKLDSEYIGGIESTADRDTIRNLVGDLVAQIEARLVGEATNRVQLYNAILEATTNSH